MSPHKARKVSVWLARLEGSSSEFRERLVPIFGNDPALIDSRMVQYRAALEAFGTAHGMDRVVVVVRAPARINLMGVHIEHRGGWVNYVAISREIVLVAERRDDDRVQLRNVESDTYPPCTFRIGAELPPDQRGDWLRFIDQAGIVQGDWGNYVKSAVLMLQDRQKDRSLVGMNLMVTGDIPRAGGLSSSSALVVASLEAALWANNVALSSEERTILCGEGEWYVGTRGGAGDHAAMLFAERGIVCHTRFFPLVVQPVPFPDGYRVVACNCLREARKSAGARSTFNERIAVYEIGLMMIRRSFPEFSDRLAYLRDVNAAHLDVGESRIYDILKALPERITREELIAEYPAEQERLASLFRTHDAPKDGYAIRGGVLFALSECERGRMTAELLSEGKIAEFGELMYISHNGDRVASLQNGEQKSHENDMSDEYLDQLILDSGSSDAAVRARARLCEQPGSYRCSCEELDQLVDIAATVPGVMGAGLTGAGLGGSILVLVREDAVDRLIETVKREYYDPKGLPLATEICSPVAGAGLI
ncbi:MAG: galactokinase family protein [Candidatus Latescibacterota bacterium]